MSSLWNRIQSQGKKLVRQGEGMVRWLQREQAFRRFLTNSPRVPSSRGQPICFVVQPWVATPVPWFVLSLALAVRQRGQAVQVLWDDTGFNAWRPLEMLQQRSIGAVLRASDIDYLRLSQISGDGTAGLSDDELESASRLNAQWRLRGEVLPEASLTRQEQIRRALRDTSRHLWQFLTRTPPRALVVGGGIFGSSGLIVRLAQKAGVRVTTFDSGKGTILMAHQGVAAHLGDIPAACARLEEKDVPRALNKAEAELRRRAAGRKGQDSFAYQTTAAGVVHDDPVGVLMPLNQSYDSAALGRHTIFESQLECVVETAGWVLEQTEHTITVRRHPVERLAGMSSTEDYGGVLRSRFGMHPRLRYLDSNADVNTYDLLRRSEVVVPYVTTVGVEALWLGKPVVTEGDSYYARMGLAWQGTSRTEYFGLLEEALAGRLLVDEERRRRAGVCYYMSQCCNWHRTHFTPASEDFDRWVADAPEEVWALPEVIRMCRAIETGEPLCWLNHQWQTEAGD